MPMKNRFALRVRLVAAALVSCVIVATPVFDCPAAGHGDPGPGIVCPTCHGRGEVTGWEYLRHEASREPAKRPTRRVPIA